MSQIPAQHYRIVFQPSGRNGAVAAGISILEAARQLGVGIEALCGGQEICGKCLVKVEQGSFPKFNVVSSLEHASPLSIQEQRWLERRNYGAEMRLACAARVQGDLLVSVPAASQAQKQVVRKTASEKIFDLEPAVRLVCLHLDPAQMDDRSDVERVSAELAQRFALENVEFDLPVINALPAAIKQGKGDLTLTIWRERQIIRVQGGAYDRPLGLAVDVGTTTIAAYLCDLRTGELLATAAGMNPQVSFGDDIMSRISFAVENKDGVERLHNAVIEAVSALGQQAAQEIGVDAAEIVDCTLVGNSVMHHLLLGINPGPLGQIPFTPVVGSSLDLRAAELGLRFNPGARVHVLPLEAGYVGADNVGVILAEAPHRQDEITLIVDVGTNGELVLGNRERLVCTSSPTGPAFEGAQITNGMRAAAGAIERVRIDPQSLDLRYKVIGSDLWSDTAPAGSLAVRGICGSGILEAVAEMFAAGIILPNGRMNKNCASARLTRLPNGQNAFVLAAAEETLSGEPVVLTQADVRAVQLAKAALFTAAQFLMKELGVDHVDRVLLAGAFGSYLDQRRAMQIGMIPDCDLERVSAVGNAAGDGARIALLNVSERREAQRLARWAEHVTTPLEGEFQQEFVAALAFPHASLQFPHVEQYLPEKA
jgi:uncharacterized 2Fe-2S/4Fe-4S cluster protein (DUF4445 family)